MARKSGKPKIAAAVGVAVGVRSDRAARVEKAMADAVLAANAEGISVEQSDEIRKRMLAARQRVLDEG